MSIIVGCPQCGRRLEAKEEWGGRRVKCPECGQILTIRPAEQPPSSRSAAPPRARPVQRPQSAQRPAAPSRGILDLLNDASISPPAGALAGSPLGPPPAKRRHNSGSNKTLFIALGSLAGVGLLVVCGVIGTALLLPAVQAARQGAQPRQDRSEARAGQQARPEALALQPSRLAPPDRIADAAEPIRSAGAVWAPDPKLANQLAVEAVFDRYSVRLPAGFASVPQPLARPLRKVRKQQNFRWQVNDSLYFFSAGITDLEQALPSPLDDLDMALGGVVLQLRIRFGLTNFTHTPGERGKLAGKQFIRSHFSGGSRFGPMHGELLLMIDGARCVILCGAINDSPGTPNYQLLEAALLTFRER